MPEVDSYLMRPESRLSSQIAVVPFPVHDSSLALPRLRAYVDETGDRGASPSSSPIFGMAAVLVDEPAERSARAVLGQLRSDFGTPASRPLSWKDDIKNNADRRNRAANLLAGISGLTVVYVVVSKRRLAEGSYRDDTTLFYNTTAFETLQRVLWAAQKGRDQIHQVEVRFGHVAKHDWTDTHRYFQIKRQQSSVNPPWALMTHLSWVSATQYEMSQIADIYGGFLKEAFWPNAWGEVDPSLLLKVWHQIRAVNGCVLTLGLMPRPANAWAWSLEWWPCKCDKCEKGRQP